MPTAQLIILWALGAFAVVVALILIFKKPKSSAAAPPEDIYKTVADGIRQKPGYRDAPEYSRSYPSAAERPQPFVKHPDERPPVRRRPHPADPVHLTARMLERVNTQRRIKGQPPMNRKGFQAAVASSPTQYRTSNDWLTYLIIYQIVTSDHESPRVYVDTGITVQPDQPGGGQYGGAGASGGWEPSAAMLAAGAAAGAYVSDPGRDPLPAAMDSGRTYSDPTPTPTPTPTPYSAPDPTPSYSDPTPTPTPTPTDTGGFSGGSSDTSPM